MPKDKNEKLALGYALKMIHVGANKVISNATVIESSQRGNSKGTAPVL